MPKFERLSNRNSRFSSLENTIRVRTPHSSKGTYFSTLRMAKKKKESSKSFAFIRNIIILALAIGVFWFVKQSKSPAEEKAVSIEKASVKKESVLSKIFSLPLSEKEEPLKSASQIETESKRNQINEAVRRFIDSVQEETSSVSYVSRSAEGEITEEGVLGESVVKRKAGKGEGIDVYLAHYDSTSGKITLIPRRRNVGYEPSLEESVKILLQGATRSEEGENIISTIPIKARLLGAKIKNNTLYLDFNEAFEENEFGAGGMRIQVYQIVYTVTQFKGIENVVFSVNGEVKEYLGKTHSILNRPFARFSDNTVLKVERG